MLQEVTDPPMADVRSKCVPGQHITFPWSAQFGRKKEINSAGDGTVQEVTDPPMADVRSKCVPGQHITFPWSAQFGRKKEINSAGDGTVTKLLMILKQSLFNEKHHFVASRKNYNEHKQAMKTTQAPHCRSEIFPAQLLPNNKPFLSHT
jgi:uncharacterized protein Veg